MNNKYLSPKIVVVIEKETQQPATTTIELGCGIFIHLQPIHNQDTLTKELFFNYLHLGCWRLLRLLAKMAYRVKEYVFFKISPFYASEV